MKNVSKGFTLVELMVVLLISSLLITASLASWQYFQQKNALSSRENTLKTAIQYARIMAFSLNRPVYFKALSEKEDWSKGLRLYDALKQEMLYEWTFNPAIWQVTWQGFGSKYLQIAANPRQSASNGQIIIKNRHTGEEKKLIINRLGRVRNDA